MKKVFLTALMLVGIMGSASAQHDDLYFVPKKKVKTEVKAVTTEHFVETKDAPAEKTLSVTAVPGKGLAMDEDAYNRRGSYLTEQGDAVSQFAMDDEGFVLITEEGDTMWMNTDTLRLTRVEDGKGWINGFDGSESDYEYAMRIIRFRNPRYAIPVSSPLYWDVVYGSALWPRWDWNVYDDGLYAYVFPTSSNWHYWDYMMGYPYGWGSQWGWHHGFYGGMHYMGHGYWGTGWYGNVWYDPWFVPHFYDYCAGWHPGWHHHGGFYPGMGGHPGWLGGGFPSARRNDRHAGIAASRQGSHVDGGVGRTTGAAASRQNSSATRGDAVSGRSSSVRVVTNRTGVSGTSAVRSSAARSGSADEVIRRSGSNTSSAVNRGTGVSSSRSTYSREASSTRSSYNRQSTSRSTNVGSGTSYSRPSSTRSSSSSVSRTSSASRSSSYYGGGSGSSSTRSSSSTSSRSYDSGSYSSGGSFSGSSSFGGGGSRGGSYGGGGSRSGGSSSGSRR